MPKVNMEIHQGRRATCGRITTNREASVQRCATAFGAYSFVCFMPKARQCLQTLQFMDVTTSRCYFDTRKTQTVTLPELIRVEYPSAQLAQTVLGIHGIKLLPVQPKFIGPVSAELFDQQRLFARRGLPEQMPRRIAGSIGPEADEIIHTPALVTRQSGFVADSLRQWTPWSRSRIYQAMHAQVYM